MAKGIFLDKGIQPDQEMLVSVLGDSLSAWESLAKYIEASFPAVSTEWKYYGKALGWSLVYKSKKKGLIYATPHVGMWQASLFFNEQAREEARFSGFSNEVIQIIEAGKNNPAGGTFDFDIKDIDEFALIEKLLQIKSHTI